MTTKRDDTISCPLYTLYTSEPVMIIHRTFDFENDFFFNLLIILIQKNQRGVQIITKPRNGADTSYWI